MQRMNKKKHWSTLIYIGGLINGTVLSLGGWIYMKDRHKQHKIENIDLEYTKSTVTKEQIDAYRENNPDHKYLTDEKIKEKLGELNIENEQNKQMHKTLKKVKKYNEDIYGDIVIQTKKISKPENKD